METSRFEQYARIAVVLLLVVGSFLVLSSFLAAILFAVILCMSTWPAYAWLRTRLGGRGSLAALIFVLGLLIVIALPVALAAQSLIINSGDLIEAVRSLLDRRESIELPAFIKELPMIGPALDSYWHKLLESRAEIVALARRFAEPAKGLALALGSAVGTGLVQVLIAIFVAFFFYRDGERAVGLFRNAVSRLAGNEQGHTLMMTAQNTIKGVVYGLIGTAVAQAFVALVGFLIAGVPGAFLLAALTFILSLIPMGPVLIWGGAAAWLYAQDQSGWAIFMLIYGAAVISSVDNFVKPILMSRAGGLSMLLVVLGVFGGAIAFGLIGLFVGPVLLAVSWTLIKTWLEANRVAPETPA
ncbi:AI-2E family transporter [Usitatibacter palustris]|uniref:Transport protein YdiK n=1 Tax=Usitatibacter palustris TaxID=2732487 RepID=A0A6M4H2C9_9PROT|nr:AI-2E family transporter [Usitatibacter palustris]QJR13699.1 Putative transport protein YdiK [Usitatibacter palustris]